MLPTLIRPQQLPGPSSLAQLAACAWARATSHQHASSSSAPPARAHATAASAGAKPGAAPAPSPPEQGVLGALGVKQFPDLADGTQRQLAQMFGSVGRVLRPYQRPRTREQHGTGAALEDASQQMWHRFDTLRVCRQSITGFSRPAVLAEACATFTAVHAAVAASNPLLVEQLKDLLVPRMYDELRANVQLARAAAQQRRAGGPKGRAPAEPKGHAWQLAKIVSADIVDAADASPVPPDIAKQVPTKLHVAQLTVRFVTQQQAVHGGQKGRQGEAQLQTFEDFWVFERPLYKGLVPKAGPYQARWRLLAQLEVPDEYVPSTDKGGPVLRTRQEQLFFGLACLGCAGLVGYGLVSML